MSGLHVKNIEWIRERTGKFTGWTTLILYTIEKQLDCRWFWWSNDDDTYEAPSLQEAQKACQADLESRILLSVEWRDE